MKARQFDQKLNNTDGQPVITLMRDPAGKAGADDGDGLYVSLVRRGANGTRVSVVKTEDPIERAQGQTRPLLGVLLQKQPTGVRAWMQKGVDLLVGPRKPAAKEPVPTFEGAIVPQMIQDALWQGSDALRGVIHAILVSDDVADPAAAIEKALDAFVGFVKESGGLQHLQAAKAEQLIEVRTACADLDPRVVDPIAAKAGRVISAANRSTLTTAHESLVGAVEALEALLKADADKAQKTQGGATTAPTEDMMKQAAIKAALDAAQQHLGRALTSEEVATIAAKAAVGEPDADLRRLMGESGAFGGNVDITREMEKALGRLPAFKTLEETVAALQATVYGVPAKKNEITGDEETAAQPGLRQLTEVAVTLATKTAQQVQGKAAKQESVPDKPNSSSEPNAGKNTAKKTDEEQDAEAFAGTGLDISTAI